MQQPHIRLTKHRGSRQGVALIAAAAIDGSTKYGFGRSGVEGLGRWRDGIELGLFLRGVGGGSGSSAGSD